MVRLFLVLKQYYGDAYKRTGDKFLGKNWTGGPKLSPVLLYAPCNFENKICKITEKTPFLEGSKFLYKMLPPKWLFVR